MIAPATDCENNRHCYHIVRKESRKLHTNTGHGPYNPDKDKVYTEKGVILRCCFCNKEVWSRVAKGGW